MNKLEDDICRVCGWPSQYLFTLPLLGRPTLYFDCGKCGYVQTENPDWLERAYQRAINITDTGIIVRNQQNVCRVIGTLCALGQLKGSVVDHAGGFGILVRMLRDAGVTASWRDRYCDNIIAKGFEATGGPCDLLTGFEVLEHLVHPVDDLQLMLAEAAHVLVSTELIKDSAPPSPDWWYLSPHHGQHIGFFRPLTLEKIAEKLGVHFATDGRSTHLFSRYPIPKRWKLYMFLNRPWLIVARLKLKSKTMDDSIYLQSISGFDDTSVLAKRTEHAT